MRHEKCDAGEVGKLSVAAELAKRRRDAGGVSVAAEYVQEVAEFVHIRQEHNLIPGTEASARHGGHDRGEQSRALRVWRRVLQRCLQAPRGVCDLGADLAAGEVAVVRV